MTFVRVFIRSHTPASESYDKSYRVDRPSHLLLSRKVVIRLGVRLGLGFG